MIVAFKGNYSGMILLEALEGERPSGEANEGVGQAADRGHGLSQGQGRRLEETIFSPFWHFHEYFKETCLLLQIASMLQPFLEFSGEPLGIHEKKKSISILHPIFSSQCVSQLVGGLLLLVLKFSPVRPLPERQH